MCDSRSLEDSDSSAWLSVAEQDELAGLQEPRRRREWKGGRWLLKSMFRGGLAVDCLSRSPVSPREIEILSRDALGRGQPPRALFVGRLLPWHLSLAHHDGIVWATVSTNPNVRVGIDVVPVVSMDYRGNELWFTDSERRWLRQPGNRELGSTLWAIKESVYKATNCGERFVPARIEVGLDAANGFTWRRSGIPRGGDDSLRVRQFEGSIVVVTSVCTETRQRGAQR